MFRTLTRSVVALMLVTSTFGCEGAVSEEDVPSEQATALTSPSDPMPQSFCLRAETPSSSRLDEKGTGTEQTSDVKRGWPCNGYLINNYSASVEVWSDDLRYYRIPAHSTSDRTNDDVDFVRSPTTGVWYKLSFLNTTVQSDGRVTNYWSQEPPPP